MKIVEKIKLKIVIFEAVKNRCLLHGRVFVMECISTSNEYPWLTIYEEIAVGIFIRIAALNAYNLLYDKQQNSLSIHHQIPRCSSWLLPIKISLKNVYCKPFCDCQF